MGLPGEASQKESSARSWNGESCPGQAFSGACYLALACAHALPAAPAQQPLSTNPMHAPHARRCDSAGQCTIVCKKGSVVISPWQRWATQYQLQLARRQPVCLSQMLASHNSAITLADGFGSRDEVYSGYLKWLGALVRTHNPPRPPPAASAPSFGRGWAGF